MKLGKSKMKSRHLCRQLVKFYISPGEKETLAQIRDFKARKERKRTPLHDVSGLYNIIILLCY